MQMKTCKGCQESSPATSEYFYTYSDGSFRGKCKICISNYSKIIHRNKQKIKYRERLDQCQLSPAHPVDDCGYIYKVELGNYYYYGQTTDPTRREYQHISLLTKQRHHNSKMQDVYNNCDSFLFTVIETCGLRDLNTVEERYILEHISDPLCMNISVLVSGVKNKTKRVVIYNRGNKETFINSYEAAKSLGVNVCTLKAWLSGSRRWPKFSGRGDVLGRYEHERIKYKKPKRRKICTTQIYIATMDGVRHFSSLVAASKATGIDPTSLGRYAKRDIIPSVKYSNFGFGYTAQDAIQMLYFDRASIRSVKCISPSGDHLIFDSKHAAGKWISEKYSIGKSIDVDIHRFFITGRPTRRMTGWSFEYV